MNQKDLFKDNAPGEPGPPGQGPAQEGVWWTLYTDGAARGNPGPAGAGAVLRDENGDLLAEVSRFLGRGTNNEAEYQGLIFGLEEALGLGARRLKMRLDSELVVKQVSGLYRVKNKRLRPLYQRVMALLQDLETYDILHIRREKNTEADALASRAAVSGAQRGRK
ncbi:MAG: ribonuclease HI family protein [Thermodesulfobacteriota bacterium]|nr:ribonuclease HI family protein [Thermodesulfobacteriota bacterium]